VRGLLFILPLIITLLTLAGCGLGATAPEAAEYVTPPSRAVARAPDAAPAPNLDQIADDLRLELAGRAAAQRIEHRQHLIMLFNRYAAHRPLTSDLGFLNDVENEFRAGAFLDNGSLHINVVEAVFEHEGSTAALEELAEIDGVYIRVVEFSMEDLWGIAELVNQHFTVGQLPAFADGLFDHSQNRIVVVIESYNEEQKAMFRSTILDSPAITFRPLIIPEMLEQRMHRLANAISNRHDGPIAFEASMASRTDVLLSLRNNSSIGFIHIHPIDMARYDNGIWRPVPHLTGNWSMLPDSIYWSSRAIQPGGVWQYIHAWERPFGELNYGRYAIVKAGAFITDGGRPGDMVYLMAEFVIEPESASHRYPMFEHNETTPYFALIRYNNLTPMGINVLLENTSDYIVEGYFTISQIYNIDPSGQRHSISTLQGSEEWPLRRRQGDGNPIYSSNQAQIEIFWGAIFGSLPPGQYVLYLSPSGHILPPHPFGNPDPDCVGIAVGFTIYP